VAEEADAQPERTLVERWLDDQQQWQRTLLTYLDSMVKDDEFLVHLGNAMRGSLLAGKPYPAHAAPETPAAGATQGERLDQVLFAVHQLQGQVADLQMTLDEMRVASASPAGAAVAPSPKPVGARRKSPPSQSSTAAAAPAKKSRARR
jgi:hypothetical protein